MTISLGDTCRVPPRRGRATDGAVHRRRHSQSGDLIVFGGPSRRIFHGVPKVLDGTGPDDLGLPPGRLSITIRETGL